MNKPAFQPGTDAAAEAFGRRPAAPSTEAPGRSMAALASAVVLPAIAATVAAYAWIYILKVPFDRPVGPLFSSAPASREGWAAWYVAPLVAAVLALALHYRFVLRPQRMTVAAMAVAGCGMSLLGATVALLVKNIGYTWYFVPGTTLMAIIGAVLPMAWVAFGNGIALLGEHPSLFFVPGIAAALLACVARLPLRAERVHALQPVQPVNLRSAGRPVVIGTAFVMAVFAGFFGLAAPQLVVPFAGITWMFVSFRHGKYSLRNIAIGSFVLGALTTLPILIGPNLNSSVGLYFLIEIVALRFPIFFVLSVGLIKAALFLSAQKTKLHA
jgi:hypothetical protein